MISQLENLCESTGITVEFISNKFIDDTTESKYNKPVIKVHKIFKECSLKVATAVVEVFTEEGNTSECIDIIENYLKEKFGPVGIRIRAPRAIIRRPPNKEASISHKNEENNVQYIESQYPEKVNHDREEGKYVEAEIFSIEVTSLKGKQEKLNNNDSLSLKDQDVMELDVVVSPPLHK